MRNLLVALIVCFMASGYAIAENANPSCGITAKVLSINERMIKEEIYHTQVWTILKMEILIENDGVAIEPQEIEKPCSEFKKGQKLKLSMIKEKDFRNPKFSNPIDVDTLLKGVIRRIKEGRKTNYEFKNVEVVTE